MFERTAWGSSRWPITPFPPGSACAKFGPGVGRIRLVRGRGSTTPQGEKYMDLLIFIASSVGLGLFLVLGLALLFKSFYRKVNQGEALIISKFAGEPNVTFNGGLVLPIVYRAEVMDIALKTIELTRRGKEGLICSDNIRADIQVTFFVRVNKTADDVLKVAQSVGCRRASEPNTVSDLFAPKFSEALKTVGKRLNFVDLYEKRDLFRDKIIEVIGQDLNGYVLEDAAIDFLEQTPIESLDRDNILDAEGIRKIKELTVAQNTRTNELVNKERMELSRQDTAADETVFRYNQQRAEALAKAERETRVAQVREQEEGERFVIDQNKNTSLTRQQSDEEVQRRNEEMLRNVEVARKQRERVVAVEQVEVVKARDLKEIEREREVELRRIAKEKEIEREKKDIADVIRARIAVDKTVAEEEERIKDTRVLAEARRGKDSVVIRAEGEAQASMIGDVKRAEALQEVAKFAAKERLIIADAQLESADREARSKVRLAEGTQAEAAAHGLAEARVKEANAVAIEKEGMAHVKVRDAEATVHEKEGMVRAKITREVMVAEAEGKQQQGLADIHVRDAEAGIIAKVGEAEARAIREKTSAEAAGIAEKAAAMAALDNSSRAHEEFRIRLHAVKDLEMARIAVQKELASVQAKVIATALQNAKFQIVGGDGTFFDRFMKALSLGNAIDGFTQQTDVGRSLLGALTSTDSEIGNEVRDALHKAGLDHDSAANLAPADLIQRIARHAGSKLGRYLLDLVPQEGSVGASQGGGTLELTSDSSAPYAEETPVSGSTESSSNDHA